jgi:hypothetical protein
LSRGIVKNYKKALKIGILTEFSPQKWLKNSMEKSLPPCGGGKVGVWLCPAPTTIN